MKDVTRCAQRHVGRCAIERTGNGGKGVMLVAELALRRQRVLLAEVPDLVRERRLLRDEKRNGNQ